jgi:hypothetical protein
MSLSEELDEIAQKFSYNSSEGKIQNFSSQMSSSSDEEEN